MREELYEQIRNCSFNIAHFMTKNYDDAEDIAQIVSLKYLLSEKKIDKPIAWSSKVAKNEVYRLTKLKKNKVILFDKTKLELFESKLLKNIDDTKSIKDHFSIKDAKTLLSKEDYHYFKIWVKHNYNVTKLSKTLQLSYYAAHCRIHRVKKNLRAAKLLHDGYIVSKDIISFNKNKNINYFIKRFVKAIQNNTLNDLRYYIPKELINDVCKLDISKIIDYDVRLLENGIYKIFLHHYTTNNQVNCCVVKLTINIRNRIRVVDLIHSPTKTIVLDKPLKKIIEKLPRKNDKGIIPIKFKDVEKMIDKGDL